VYGGVDFLVGIAVEVFGFEGFADFVDGFVHEQDAAEDAFFRVEVLRWQPQFVFGRRLPGL
jgi:hypothetical protein